METRISLRGLGGWRTGWKQFRTRTRIIVLGPKKIGRWEFDVRHYPHWKNGVPREEFRFVLQHEQTEAERRCRNAIAALYGY